MTDLTWHSPSSCVLPVPKGHSPYALAKKAEYIQRDRLLAKTLYQQAIDQGDRVESAVKDLASILHQEGNTQGACKLLLQYQEIFRDQQKYLNLLKNLQDKLVPAGNSLVKQLRVAPLTDYDTENYVRSLFRDHSRVIGIDFVFMNGARSAILKFSSHSAARKTLAGFRRWEWHCVEWLNAEGVVVGRVREGKRRRLPLPAETEDVPCALSAETAAQLLGRALMTELFTDCTNYR